MQGFDTSSIKPISCDLGPINEAFPNGSFPLGSIHEFLSETPENSAAANGFIAGIVSSIMGKSGASLWISSSRKLFPPALKSFGIEPDHFIFIDLAKEKDVLWAMDEALKCEALSTVIGEMKAISFTASRRLQLAVEQSKVTGFVIINSTKKPSTTACVTRWRITPLATESIDRLPGVGFPKWKVELLRMRNGKTGSWDVTFINGKFIHAQEVVRIPAELRKVV